MFKTFSPLVALTNLCVSKYPTLFTSSERTSIPSQFSWGWLNSPFSAQKSQKEKRKKEKNQKKKREKKNIILYYILLLVKEIYFVYPFILRVIALSSGQCVDLACKCIGGNENGIEAIEESNPYQQEEQRNGNIQRTGANTTRKTKAKTCIQKESLC